MKSVGNGSWRIRDSFIEVDKSPTCRLFLGLKGTFQTIETRRGCSRKLGRQNLSNRRRLIEKSRCPDSEGNFRPLGSELDSVGDDRWGWLTLKNPQAKDTRPNNRWPDITCHVSKMVAKISTIEKVGEIKLFQLRYSN